MNNIKNNEDAGTYEFLKAEHHKEEFLCNKKN